MHKPGEYRRRFRTLACTFLTFSPDGNEILVNLGGEQIYLFDIFNSRRPQKYDTGSRGIDTAGVNGTKDRKYDTVRG